MASLSWRQDEAETMTVRTLDAAAAPPAALTAFLRGIERRGAVFAELATGSATAGDAVLADTMHAFRGLAAAAPFAEWPRRFWSLLLASPRLRGRPARPAWPLAFAPLSGLGGGPRAALLLRLVAGLADADAAAVLGVARPTYRLALQRALPHREDGTPDPEAWQALGEAAQAAIRQLPAERLAEIARQREAAIRGHRAPRARADGRARPPVRWRAAQWGIVAATALALAATWWLPGADIDGPGPEGIDIESLPPAAAPAATYDADAALLTHRDFDLLLAAEDTPAAADPGFHAWYAAQMQRVRSDEDADPLPIEDAAAPVPTDAVPETDDAPR